MPSSLPDIDFRNIRPFGQSASRAAGFEGLACILLERFREWPDGIRFERFGAPDGGREGRATLPDGSVTAWQVKYLFRFDSTAASQVGRSFHRTLDTEPKLCHYVVVLPIDLPAGDTNKRMSAHTRWTTKVKEWEGKARESGREVEFEFVGLHELSVALLNPSEAGLIRYWFDQSFMDVSWFQKRMDTAIAKAGPRYSPKLHTETRAVSVLNGVGRTSGFETSWRKGLARLRESRRFPWRAPEDASKEVADVLTACENCLDEVDGTICSVISSISGFKDIPEPRDQILSARRELSRLSDLLHAEYWQKNGYHYPEPVRTLRYKAQQAYRALDLLLELEDSEATQAARSREVLIEGAAGTGKTHLLCDAAQKRVESGLPTVLVMGQDFDRWVPRNQIPHLTSFDGSVDEEVAALATASQAVGVMGLLIIDALNESEQPTSWKDDLRVLQQIVARHDQVALVVSCRSEFLPDVIGETSMPKIKHEGFDEATEDAVMRFAQEYGFEAVSFPVLNPEFSNPLFLKLTCEALKTLGYNRFPLGSAGLTTVCDAFLDAVNHRLALPERCDFDKESRFVQQAVERLALELLNSERFSGSLISRERAKQILGEILPRSNWSESLLKGLLDEGVLIATSNGIGFGYQRLGDVAVASRLCADTTETGDRIKEWVAGLSHDRWFIRGVLGVLAVMLPERKRVELIDILNDDNEYNHRENLDLFVQSLPLRATEAVSDRTVHILQRLLCDDYTQEAVCEVLVRLSCVPGHPLNSKWIHAWLLSQELPRRDALWSVFLVNGTQDSSPIGRLISWARNSGSDAEPDVRRLAGLILGWMLTTSDNRVRDQATKALVALLESDPRAARDTLKQFSGVNDPYVIERLTGVACGIALRSADPDSHHQLATGLAELVGCEWPAHLLTCDYAHRVFRLALATDWAPPSGTDPNGHPYSGPPYGTELPSPVLTTDEIERMTETPNHDYLTIWLSLGEWGDFGRYVLSSAIQRFETQNKKELLDLSRRAVFERVIDLGWSPEVFSEIDDRLHHYSSISRIDHAVERIGKKYQRIAFYELLGNLADNLVVSDPLTDELPVQYSHAEQLAWRDIDPTFIAQKADTAATTRQSVWFSPQQAEFDPNQTGQPPSDINGMPDPLALIAVQDDNRRSWLVLESLPVWSEALHPDEEVLNRSRLDVWMQIRSYLIPATSLPAIRDWAADKDWHCRWMPESVDIHSAFLASHPNDPAWASASGEIDEIDWRISERKMPPCDLWKTAASYGGTGGNRDQSAHEQAYGLVPSRRLYDLLDLNRAGDFVWMNSEGIIIVQDPSATGGEPSTLLASREETVSRLASNSLTVFWTVLAGKDLIKDIRQRDESPQWISSSAVYALDGEGVVRCLSATARLRKGPTEIKNCSGRNH